MTPDPAPAPGAEPEAAPPVPPATGPSPFQLVAIAAAVAGGGLATLLVMASRPAAREGARVPSPTAVAAPRAASLSSAGEESSPVWSSTHQSRWISNHRKAAAFELEANRPVAVWTRQVRPTLVVRCMDGRTDVFVYTESAARIETEDDNHTVRVAFDEESGTHERWPDSVEHDALFAPDGTAMAARIQAARRMHFTFSPHNAAPATATFEVAGLSERLAPIATHCGR